MVTIKIIVGSTRSSRFGTQPAEWIKKLGDTYADKAKFELVDLKEVDLPFFDEVNPPMMDKYENDHTKAWAEVIGAADGFIFVTPEYNHSYNAALKNAIDFLYKEWNNKPVGFVSYGASEGGARAVEHLRPIVGTLGMFDLTEHVTIHNYFFNLDENYQFKFDESYEKKATAMLDKLVFWAEKMQAARAELAQK